LPAFITAIALVAFWLVYHAYLRLIWAGCLVFVLVFGFFQVRYTFAQVEPTAFSMIGNGFAQLITLYVYYHIVRAGWDIYRAAGANMPRTELERILTLDPDPTVGNYCLRIFGIPSVCRFLPVTRRIIASGLFVLAALAFSLFILVLPPVPSALVLNFRVTYECFMEEGNDAACWVSLAKQAAVLLILGIGILIGGSLAFVAGWRFIARRFSRLSLEGLVSKDKRPPILFLRSFHDDQVRLSKPRQLFFRRVVSVGEPRPTLDHVLLEEGTPFGPVVAIGAPGSTPPFGAARKYVIDQEWRDTIVELCRQSAAVVATIDQTEGVCWELRYLMTADHRQRTLFLVPPRLAQHDELARILPGIFPEGEEGPGWIERLRELLRSEGGYCIGWFWRSDEELDVMSTTRPSSLAYTVAVRRFLRVRRHSYP